MDRIKLLNKSFNIVDVRHVPTFLVPYAFVISLPRRLILITPEDETPDDLLSEPRHTSCFVIESEDAMELLSTANAIMSLLTNANIDVHMMTSEASMSLFVDTDNAMNAVMLLSSNGYDVVFTEI